MDKRTKAKIEKLCKKYGIEQPTAVFRIVGRPLSLVVNDEGDVISPTWRFPSDGGERTFPVGLYVVSENNAHGYGPKMVGTTCLSEAPPRGWGAIAPLYPIELVWFPALFPHPPKISEIKGRKARRSAKVDEK